jgi:hypothetical protein
MALYRLLETTIEDSIYATKLKADMLWVTTRHSDALDEYVRMVEQCEERGRLNEALSIVKMLMKIAPEIQDYHLMYTKLKRRSSE